MINTNGYVLHEDDTIAVIATGFKAASTNAKTGAMVQIYIILRHKSPMDGVTSGADVAICGDCVHRATYTDGVMVPGSRRCYVNLGKGARAVHACYARGGYRKLAPSDIPAIFAGLLVRFGAYGDPAMMPQWLVVAIAAAAAGRTGYTHQWRTATWLRPFVMASCDSAADAVCAVAAGWRYFRVATFGDTVRSKGEISCPASAEAGKKTTCSACKLCNGSSAGDRRKSIVIQDHSVIARSNPLIQISL
tara:strand:- start:3 stop:746 length:744 start_codon:yes stop_codon:yes gene_type:complete